MYSFNEILDHIDLKKFLTAKECRIGRPRCDSVKLLKIVLFSFMENGCLSLRNIEKACKTDIRYMWLLDGMNAPSYVTFGNFIKNDLGESVEAVFQAEGTYGSMKWNRSYKRAFRRGLKDVILEFTLIAIGFNLWKYHNKTRNVTERSESA